MYRKAESADEEADRTLNLDCTKKKSICSECVNDPALKSFIRANAKSKRCSFCAKKSSRPIGLAFVRFARHIYGCISPTYLDGDGIRGAISGADAFCMFCSTEELLRDELPQETNREWIELLAQVLGKGDWCTYIYGDKPPIGDGLIEEWEHFCHFIKHQRRHFFIQEGTRRGRYDYSYSLKGRPFLANEMLAEVGRACERFRLVRILKKGTIIFRARIAVRGAPFKTTFDLGPPNETLAKKPNRMSPAGIVMFYSCDSPEAAIAEIGGQEYSAVVGEFVLEKTVRILDLSELPRRASAFDLLTEEEEGSLEFLHHFRAALAEKVEADGYEHVDYVPSQVITEWFRTVFRDRGRRLHGICYPSVQYPAGRCLALFASQLDLVLPAIVKEAAINGAIPNGMPSVSAILRVLAEQDRSWIRLLQMQRYVKGRTRGTPRAPLW